MLKVACAVDLPGRKPNCVRETLLSAAVWIRPRTKVVKILYVFFHKEMGL
jgi:hypothetical protein